MARYYSKEHEWIEVLDGEATVGITNHAQQQLGDVVFVELPEENATVKAGQEVAVVESVKAASDVFSPVGGIIRAINQEIVENPALINSSAEDEAWFFKLSIDKGTSFESFMDGAAYRAFLKSID